MKRDSRLPGLALVSVVAMYGVGPPVSKLISAPPFVSASVRSWLVAPLAFAIARIAGRRLTASLIRATAVAGVLFASNILFLFAALQRVSVAVVAVALALQPALVLVVAGPVMHERVTRWQVAWTVVGVGGVLGVVFGGDPEIRGDALGIVFAFLCVASYTGYYLINRTVRTTTALDPLEWMMGVTMIAAISIAPVTVVVSSRSDFGELGGADWIYMAIVVVVIGLLSHTVMSWAHRFFNVSLSSTFLLSSNVMSVLVAWPIHDEPITLLQAVAGAVVLGAVTMVLRERPTAPAVVVEPP